MLMPLGGLSCLVASSTVPRTKNNAIVSSATVVQSMGFVNTKQGSAYWRNNAERIGVDRESLHEE